MKHVHVLIVPQDKTSMRSHRTKFGVHNTYSLPSLFVNGVFFRLVCLFVYCGVGVLFV